MDSATAYECNAQNFLSVRDHSIVGSALVQQWANELQTGADVLEIGCGGGYPITRVLQSAGLNLSAIDSSPTLVSTFKSRFPTIPVQCSTVQEYGFSNDVQDGAIAIGLIFLLAEEEQLALIENVASTLRLGGRFLFTAPIEKGTWRDVNTDTLCQSLGQSRYVEQLMRAGFRLIGTYTDVGENNYYDVELMATQTRR